MIPSPFDSAPAALASAVDTSTTFARIDKFDGTNFHVWKFKMQMVLEDRDLWDLTSGDVIPEHCFTYKDQATYKRKARKAFAIICLAMEDSQLPLVRSSLGALEAWTKLVTHFEKKSLANKPSCFVVVYLQQSWKMGTMCWSTSTRSRHLQSNWKQSAPQSAMKIWSSRFLAVCATHTSS